MLDTLNSLGYWAKILVYIIAWLIFIIIGELGLIEFFANITIAPLFHYIYPEAVVSAGSYLSFIGVMIMFSLFPSR